MLQELHILFLDVQENFSNMYRNWDLGVGMWFIMTFPNLNTEVKTHCILKFIRQFIFKVVLHGKNICL